MSFPRRRESIEQRAIFCYNSSSLPRSSSGLGYLVLIQEITGSNPVRGTKYIYFFMTQKKTTFNPYFSIILAALIWGSNGIFVKYLNLPVITFTFLRFAVPTILLLLFFLSKGENIFKKGNKTIWLASFLNATRQPLYFVGFLFTSVGNAVILWYAYPIFTAIFGAKILKEEIDKKLIFLLAMAFLGILLIFIGKPITFSSKDFVGMISIVFSAVIYGLSLVFLKKEEKSIDQMGQVFYQNILGALIFLPLLFFVPVPPMFKISLGVFHAFLIGLVGMLLFFYGLKKIKVSTATFLCYLEVVSGIVLAWFFLKEVPTWNMVVGGGLILTAVTLLRIEKPKDVELFVEA